MCSIDSTSAREVLLKQLFLCLALLGSFLSSPAHSSASTSGGLQQAYVAAAREFGVPLPVLLSVSYNLTLWENHGGAPSTTGNYGPMGLTEVTPRELGRRAVPAALRTLVTAARLLHEPARLVERDPLQNIRAGAALLAWDARRSGRPRTLTDWARAVALYGGMVSTVRFARVVFATIARGAGRDTSLGPVVLAGETVDLAGVDRALGVRGLPQQIGISATGTGGKRPESGVKQTSVECPADLDCRFVPAAYEANSRSDPEDYGNYDVANRPKNGLRVRYIVIHDTESTYDSAISSFQDPRRYASANYVIRSSDGQVTQMVPDRDIAWHAGNYYVNMHAIGIEHEGFAIQGATWYNEQLYQTSAELVAYLAARFHVPLDRAHIVGHDQVPGLSPQTQGTQHWDPGPYWDWAHYMDLLAAPLLPAIGDSPVITIDPPFATNQPNVSSCSGTGSCSLDTPQGANFVYLHTAPDQNAPLLGDPALHPDGSAGTQRADDWGDKAVAGQQFAQVDRQGEWTAIDYGGQEAWFYDPDSAPNALPGAGQVITPRPGLASIPVYGAPYPNPSEYPRNVKKTDRGQSSPLPYTIPAGQSYVAYDLVRADFYWSPTPSQHAVIKGKARYYEISFNHRFAYVRAADVSTVS